MKTETDSERRVELAALGIAQSMRRTAERFAEHAEMWERGDLNDEAFKRHLHWHIGHIESHVGDAVLLRDDFNALMTEGGRELPKLNIGQ